MMMNRWFGMGVIGLIIWAGFVGMVRAQDGAPPLTLVSADRDRPVQFQRIAPGTVPVPSAFVSRLEIDLEVDPAANMVYVAIENTGWSIGVIGLISDALAPDEHYVALEVDGAGSPIMGGLAFDLTADETDGWVLRVLIAQARTFGIFRVMEGDGLAFEGVTHKRYQFPIVPEPFAVTVAPEPVFAPLVLDCHIVARPVPVAEPVTEPGSASATWGDCGSCDACGHAAAECVVSPAGECLWDPSTCGGPVGCAPDGSLRCVTETPDCSPGSTPVALHICYDSCGNTVSVDGGACIWLAE